jgi:hypothetical protein
VSPILRSCQSFAACPELPSHQCTSDNPYVCCLHAGTTLVPSEKFVGCTDGDTAQCTGWWGQGSISNGGFCSTA